MTERPDSLTVHIPPAYNRYGNRQVYFVETGREEFDELLNGALLGLIAILLLAGAAGALGAVQ